MPRIFQFAVPMEPHAYDPAKSKKLLAEAGYPNGFDAGDFNPFPPYNSMGEAVIGNLQAVGIRAACARWSAPPTSPRGARRSCTA